MRRSRPEKDPFRKISEPYAKRLSMPRKSVLEPIAEKAAARKPQGRVCRRLGYIDVSEAAEPRLVGYARVSTDEQTTRLQLDALKAAGCQRIFQDKLGGALRSRPQMDRALADLRAGDTLVVWKTRSAWTLAAQPAGNRRGPQRSRRCPTIAGRTHRHGDGRRQNALFGFRRRRAVRARRTA